MTDQPTPETDAKLADDPQPSSDSPDYARALEIHIHLLRDELADERAKKSDALIAAVDDIERLTAERDTLRETAHNNSVFWSARDGTGELRHYKASPEEASKLIVALGNEWDDLSEALERNCVQYVQKQQALIADRDALRAERDDAAALAKNYAERMKRSDAELAEARALLGLLADIRAAVGDPTGKLMQDELVERCRKLRADNELLRAAKEGA